MPIIIKTSFSVEFASFSENYCLNLKGPAKSPFFLSLISSLFNISIREIFSVTVTLLLFFLHGINDKHPFSAIRDLLLPFLLLL